MSNKKQTAVEWLAEKYYYITWTRNRDEISAEVADELRKLFLEQAKEIDKQQKIDFANNYGFDVCGYDYERAEQYYKETYK